MKRLRQIGDDPAEDRGAALILALFIVTFIGLAGAALLTFSDTSIRTTVALRDQAATAYAADGAARVAVNQLTSSTNSFPCTTASGLTLPNFYPGPNGAAASSAYVWCTPDGLNGTGGSSTSENASPGSAILTLGTVAGGEDGIALNTKKGKSVNVRGGIFSNSTIKIDKGTLTNTLAKSYTYARGDCTGQITPTPLCNYATADPRGIDPGTISPHGASYDAPPPPKVAGTISTCSNNETYQIVTPGKFTSADDLSALSGCSENKNSTSVVVFQPGTYYFDFSAGQPVWKIQGIYAIAGTPTAEVKKAIENNDEATVAAQMTTACVLPQDGAATSTSGVELVFGGTSRLELKNQGKVGAQLTVCASKSPSGPPIAVYGLKSDIGSGPMAVSRQKGCITDLKSCALLLTDNSPKSTLTIQGTVYTPQAWLNLKLNNNTTRAFSWGLIARALTIDTTASVELAGDIIGIPDVATTTPVPNNMYLSVYVCPGSSTCAATGTVQLRAKVLLSTTTPTTATILSWSVQR